MIKIRKLPPERWRDYRSIRLRSLRTEPSAFASSYFEERQLSGEEWRRRMANVFFALHDDRPVGTIVVHFESHAKMKHIANIFGVYVDKKYRGRGIGKKLVQSALSEISKNKDAVKVRLAVNTAQEAAVKLYEGMGFTVSGRMKKELKVNNRFYDEFSMEKLLDDS